MENLNNTRGSEWKRWDLHVHSPASEGFSGSWDQFKTQLQNADCEVIGINDYFSVEGYKTIKDEIGNANFQLSDKNIFPVVEMRMRDVLQNRHSHQSGTNLNFHIIFSDQIDIEIVENFIKSLEVDGNQISTRYANKSYLKDTAKVNFQDIIDQLSENTDFRDNFIIWLPYNAYGGIDGIDPKSDDWIKRDFIKKTHILGSSSEGCISFFSKWISPLNPDSTPKFSQAELKVWFKVKKPCIKGSDLHKYNYPIGKLRDENSDPIQKYCWIKADTTSKGLKQIIYEPEERVRIQKDDPTFEFNKPFFTNVNLNEDIQIFRDKSENLIFCKNSIPLNKNLIAIIGGRGTGKSMLIDYWANIFFNNNESYSSDKNFVIEYSKDNLQEPTIQSYKGDQDNHLDFIYIEQNRLKEISKKEKIGEEVKKLLKIENLSFSNDLNLEIKKINEEIHKLEDWFLEEDEEGNNLNNRKYVETSKQTNEELLKSITTKKNKKKLEKYTNNISEIREIEANIELLSTFQEEISQSELSINNSIEEINKKLPKENDFVSINKLSFKTQIDQIQKNTKAFQSLKKLKDNENHEIKTDFEREGFTGDLVSLLENADIYQSQIKWAEKQLSIIEKKESELNKNKQKRKELAEKIKTEYERQKKKIDISWQDILSKHEGDHRKLIDKILLKEGKITVEGEIVFDSTKFYEKIYEIVDKRSYKNINDLKGELKIDSFESYIDFISSNLHEYLDGERSERFSGIKDIFFGIKERNDYLRTIPNITYIGKELERLSAGQRGTVYLCLKLATDAFSTPIIFDQPEDDLDNEFIMNELVDIFKTLKKYRQIIIVTHNANLVVNADADQVIVASNDEEKLNYYSGSLENPNIIDNVCQILEGGKEAFERRKNKYNFQFLYSFFVEKLIFNI